MMKPFWPSAAKLLVWDACVVGIWIEAGIHNHTVAE